MAALINLEDRTSLDDSFPKASPAKPQDERAITRLIRLLETRIQRRDLLQEDVREKQNHFRNILVELERENATLRYDNNEQKKMISTLESRVCKLQNHIDGLLYKLNNACDIVRNVQEELRDRDRQLKQHMLEKQKIIQRCNVKIQAEADRMAQEMEMELQEQRERLMSYIKKKDDKMRLVRQILTSAREDTSDNMVIMTTPIASSSRIETAEKANLMPFKEEPSAVMPINLQASRRPRRQICQALSRHTISNDSQEKVAERPSSSKEKLSTVTLDDSQSFSPRGQICQTLSFRAKTQSDNNNSDEVQRKGAKESIPITESSMPSDSKIEISEELNPLTPVDSPSSSTIASADTVVTKIKLNTKIPVVNPRYQRTQNTNRWIDHRPTGIVPTGTILQPRTQPHKRTIRKLTNPKDFVARSSRYCLLSQEQDADGGLETKLYKADVLPTCGGGAQIVFSDIECLRQMSPTTRKNATDR